MEEPVKDLVLASPGHRIGAAAVDAGLYIVTFGIGWLIWNLIVWADGQTPAKKILKVRVVNEADGKPVNWGQMCIRQFLIPLATSLFFLVPYYIWVYKGFSSEAPTVALVAMFICLAIYVGVYVTDFVWLFLPTRKRLIDYWAKTLVINEAA